MCGSIRPVYQKDTGCLYLAMPGGRVEQVVGAHRRDVGTAGARREWWWRRRRGEADEAKEIIRIQWIL